MPPSFTIRPARLDAAEMIRLQAIEDAAGALFVEVGMPEIAEDGPPSFADLRTATAIFVAVDAGDQALGYAQIELVDGQVHLEQLSVDPAFGRQGIGAALLDVVVEHARLRGDGAVTLTTFRDVPFNRPYYERQGFEVTADDQRGPELVTLMATEAAHGLDPDQRVAMRLVLDPEAPSEPDLPARGGPPGGPGPDRR